MKALAMTFLLYVAMIIFMILVNESNRHNQLNITYRYKGILTINPGYKPFEKCSWVCHNNTRYCKGHHVNFNKAYFKYTDIAYFGVIKMLKGTGSYAIANVLILVIFIPFLCVALIIKGLELRFKSKNIQ